MSVQNAFRAAFETQQDIPVVIEFAAFNKRGDVGGQFFDLQTSDVFGEVFRVRADVADAAARAAAFRVGAPGGLFLSGGFETCGEPALRIFDDDFADFAELAGADHVARFFDERIAGVIVRQAVEQAGFLDEVARAFWPRRD